MPVYPLSTAENFKSSKAERAILDRFLNSNYVNNNKTFVFHSIRAQEINNKVVGEIDFIYLDDEFLLFLEVKGGMVYFSEKTRSWYVMNGEKEQDPWKQVADYLFHVRDRLLPQNFKDDYFQQKIKFGYGVLFPDCKAPSNFNQSYSKKVKNYSYEYDLNLVYDAVDHQNLENGLEFYIERLKKYWKNHGSNHNKNGVNEEELQRIKNYFSKDIIFEPAISEVLNLDQNSTIFFTQEQGRFLDFCLSNPQYGYIINGGPGTGKTVLAFDLAIKFLKKGEKVLMVVFNQPLRDFLLNELKRLFLENKISPDEYKSFKIDNISRLMTSNLTNNFKEFKINVDDDSFWESLPYLFLEKFKNKSLEKFDRLIVDECQDLANEANFNVLSLFLKGGFEKKKFVLFIDTQFQLLYSEKFESSFFEEFSNKNNVLTYSLTRNCRNSKNIIEEASINTGFPIVESMKGNVFETELKFYKDEDELFSGIMKILDFMRKAQVNDKLISVIVDDIKLRDKLLKRIPQSIQLSKKYFDFPDNKLAIDTDKRFKGLDNEFIIYVGTDFNSVNPEKLSRLYVSITRAKGRLSIFFPFSKKDEINAFRSINGIKIFTKTL
ncbi:MAG: DUF2075 domain-containing protein [Ignavibacteriae bacterium]|nr:DUF2075 domain-containing protein [Ignavibacteriota bacterium]